MNFHLTTKEFTQENSSIIWVAHMCLHGLQQNVSGQLARLPDTLYDSLHCKEVRSK